MADWLLAAYHVYSPMVVSLSQTGIEDQKRLKFENSKSRGKPEGILEIIVLVLGRW